MRSLAVVLALLSCAGCGAVVEPGHRALFFDPRNKGLQHEVLGPGYYRVGVYGRLDDFDVTYSTHKELVRTTSSEGLQLDLHLAVIYRPIVAEIYELDTEIGQNYYDEVVGPEFRSASRGVFARHSYGDLQKANEKIEDEIETDLRRRIRGKHIEISSVTMEGIDYAPEIAAAVRAKLVGEQEALRQKAAIENEALKRKLELEHLAVQNKIKAEQTVQEKQNERVVAEEDAKIAKVRAEGTIIQAKAEAEQRTVLAKAYAEEKKAEAKSITWLEVQMHAYDALGKLGGSGTHIMLGDWSRLPNFLFPSLAGLGGSPTLPTGYAPGRAPSGPTRPISVPVEPR
jgi:regulator of protease activity HflC (stomatin/prohibitin superfamily)